MKWKDRNIRSGREKKVDKKLKTEEEKENRREGRKGEKARERE